MRFREPFSIYCRALPSGRKVYYYQTYDERGRRTTARSTGQANRAAARRYCMELYRQGILIPRRGEGLRFADFAEDWFIPGKCEFLKYKNTRRPVTERYAHNCRSWLVNQILPFFGDCRLSEITSYQIDQWLLSKKKAGLSHSTANTALFTLRTMLNEAVRQGPPGSDF